MAAPEQLASAAREELLRIARTALVRSVQARSTTDPDVRSDRVFRADCGAFVSLHTRDWDIRGCVGCMTADRPLPDVVWEMAGAAALRDPRFDAVRPDELDDLIIEISVLTPAEPIDSLDAVEIGRDGLLVVSGARRGVLLPQVASEHGWDASTFAEQTCLKASLDRDAWRREGVRLFKFSAEVFSEANPASAPS